MTVARIRLAALAVALTAASSAHAATITVNARSGGGGASGQVVNGALGLVCNTGTVCPVTFTPPGNYTLDVVTGANTGIPTWVGCTPAGSPVGASCILSNVTSNRTVTATFPPATWPLTVKPASANGGTGTVSVAVTPVVACAQPAGCVAPSPPTRRWPSPRSPRLARPSRAGRAPARAPAPATSSRTPRRASPRTTPAPPGRSPSPSGAARAPSRAAASAPPARARSARTPPLPAWIAWALSTSTRTAPTLPSRTRCPPSPAGAGAPRCRASTARSATSPPSTSPS